LQLARAHELKIKVALDDFDLRSCSSRGRMSWNGRKTVGKPESAANVLRRQAAKRKAEARQPAQPSHLAGRIRGPSRARPRPLQPKG